MLTGSYSWPSRRLLAIHHTSGRMPLGVADTRSKLIDPALHARSWTEDLIRREETAGAVEVVGERARRRPKGRVDYTLRLRGQRRQPARSGRTPRGEGRASATGARARAGQDLRRVPPPQRPSRLRLERPSVRRIRQNHRANDQPAAAEPVPHAGRASRPLRAGDGLQFGVPGRPPAPCALPRRRGYAALLPGRRDPCRPRELARGEKRALLA